ncbi:MAG: CHAT domain-containing protein, partial [Bacteroidales bacterium]|nr:CHAT domain-containing protein [Bacteroidales bacterium]
KAIACLDTLQYPSWNIMASCHSQLSLYYSELGEYGLFNDHYQKAKMIAKEKPMSAYNKTLAFVNIAEAVLRFSPDSCLALIEQIKGQQGYVNFVFPVASIEAEALIQLGKSKEAISIVNDLFDQKDDFKGYQIPVINVDDDLVEQAHLLGLIDESYRKLSLLNENQDYTEIVGILIDRQNNAFLKLMETDVYGQEIVSAVSDYHRFVVSAIDFLLEHNAEGRFNKDLIKLFTTSKALQLTANIVKSSIQSGLESDTAGFAIIMRNVEEVQGIKNELNRKDLDVVAQQELKTSLNSLLIDYLMLRSRLGENASLPSLALEIPDQVQLQALLAEDEGIIEYIQADSILYWFFIAKDQVKIGKRTVPDLDNLINQQIYACKTGSAFDGLEKELFGDVESSLVNIKRLHIIPDKKLSLFPFEMLSLPGSGNKLIERFEVSYSYSNALWYMNKVSGEERLVDGVLVIAPVFESRKEQQNDAFIAYRGHEDLVPLLESGAEADNIKVLGLKYQKGVDVLKGMDANEYKVRASLGKHGIVHFATHGLVNKESDERSGLFLSDIQAGEGQNKPYDGFMSQGELYHLKLNANLVVLSACNTGVGSVWEGEGVLSLPRGFIYAGVPNVIASLWRVNDKKTREFMSMFYEYVFQGESYSKALQKAK